MGLKENLYYDRDSISYPVVYRQKKNNINTKKTNEITEQIRNRNSKAHKRNINRQNDRLKKYSNYIDDDEIIQLKNIDKKPGKTSPNGIETSSIDILYNEKNINNLTPKKINTPMKKKIPVTKYITPVKTEINGKYITPSKMPRQTTGNEDTPTKSPFSETLPDGILISSPVCITPLKSTIPLNSSSSSLSSYNNITNITNNNHNTITITSSISTLSITSPSSNNLNISNITTPSQKKLNTLSPPSSSTSPPQSTPQLAPDVVSRAIFHALFGSLNKSMSSSLPWDDDDEDEDCDDVVCDDLYQCKSVEPVDELWFTRLMSTSLLTTQALNYALHTTGTTTATSFFQQQVNRGNPILTQDDLLSNYINPSFITSLISQLPYEDERFTSPRLSVLKAIYKTVPKFRSLIAYSLLSVSNQRFMRCKTSSKLAVMYELDINHTGTKIGDMYSYSIPEHVDINSAYSCFPVDDIPYPPNQKSKLPNQPPLIAQTSSTQYSTTSNNTASTPTINIRDHDQSIIELALYMIITTEQEDDDEELESNFDEQDLQKDQDKEQLNDEKHNLLNSKPSLSRLFLSTVINVLRCYGRRLGKTTEGVEQPNILKSCLRAFEEMIVRVKDDSIEKVIIPAILHSWPGGGNSIREAAFLKALGVVLPHCRPYFIINPFITNNSNSSLSSSTSTSLSILTKSLSLPPSTALYKTLTRVILCINSIHFKVCQESMNLISNEKILSHYLYDSEECRHLLDTLVNALRQNRNHWNISVKQTSERCLDQIYELME